MTRLEAVCKDVYFPLKKYDPSTGVRPVYTNRGPISVPSFAADLRAAIARAQKFDRNKHVDVLLALTDTQMLEELLREWWESEREKRYYPETPKEAQHL